MFTLSSSNSNQTQTETPYSKYADVYTDQFITGLARDFDLDENDPLTRERLYEIPYRFHLARRIDDGGKALREMQKEFETLAKRLVSFQEQMHRLDGYGLDSELWHGARMLPSFDPELDSEDYPDFIYKRSIAYRYEFQRYLNFLQLGLDSTIKRMKNPGGRPKDEGLHLAVRYITNFWTFDLNREYTVDYHEGSGISLAFEFTNRLIQQIEKTDERRIVTAMRTVIRQDQPSKSNDDLSPSQ